MVAHRLLQHDSPVLTVCTCSKPTQSGFTWLSLCEGPGAGPGWAVTCYAAQTDHESILSWGKGMMCVLLLFPTELVSAGVEAGVGQSRC